MHRVCIAGVRFRILPRRFGRAGRAIFMLHGVERYADERDGVAHFCVAQIKQHIDTFRVAQEHFADFARTVDQPAIVADQLEIEQLSAASES